MFAGFFIRFLRKEKEIALSKLEIVQTESNSVKHRYERQQKELEEVKQNLTEQQIKAQVCVEQTWLSSSPSLSSALYGWRIIDTA